MSDEPLVTQEQFVRFRKEMRAEMARFQASFGSRRGPVGPAGPPVPGYPATLRMAQARTLR